MTRIALTLTESQDKLADEKSSERATQKLLLKCKLTDLF